MFLFDYMKVRKVDTYVKVSKCLMEENLNMHCRISLLKACVHPRKMINNGDN